MFAPAYLGWFTMAARDKPERYEVSIEHGGFDIRGDPIVNVVVGHHRFAVPAHITTAIIASVVK